MIVSVVILAWVASSITMHLIFEDLQRWWAESGSYYLPDFDEEYGRLRAVYVIFAPIPIAISLMALVVAIAWASCLLLWMLFHWISLFLIQTFRRTE